MADIFSSLDSVTHLFLRFILTHKLFFSTLGSNFPSRLHLTPAPRALLQVSICLSAVFLRPTPSKDQKPPILSCFRGDLCGTQMIKINDPIEESKVSPQLCLPLPRLIVKTHPTQESLSFLLTTICLLHHVSLLLQY